MTADRGSRPPAPESRPPAPGPLSLWRLPFPLVLALRYLRSTRRDAFVSFLSLVAAGGIALGVTALILALAAMAGLQTALRSEVLERTPHLQISVPGTPISDGLLERLEEVEGIVDAKRSLPGGRGWLRSGSLVQPVELVGFEGRVPRYFPGAESEEPGLYIGDALAARWGARPGDVLEIISPRPILTPFGPQPRVRSIRLEGTFRSGRTEERERIAVPYEVARSLAGSEAARIDLTATDLEGALEAVPALRKIVPADAKVTTWQELNRPLFFALRLEKTTMFVALSLVVVVAALALVADLALLVSNKRVELGMLGAMGATPQSLRRAFVALGTLIGGIGVGTGAAVGVAVAVVLERAEIVRLPRQVYFLDHLPFRVEAADLVAVLGVAMLLAVGSSFVVAQRLSRLDPAEALRG